jgi:hypothetical protein
VLGSLFGGGASTGTIGGTAGILPAIYHSGGLVGDAAPRRLVPLDIFRTAPRFHDGAFLKSDEVPAILQRGERVLSREEARRYGSRAASPVINVTIQTPSPLAFQGSRTQIAADLARAVRLGVRGM